MIGSFAFLNGKERFLTKKNAFFNVFSRKITFFDLFGTFFFKKLQSSWFLVLFLFLFTQRNGFDPFPFHLQCHFLGNVSGSFSEPKSMQAPVPFLVFKFYLFSFRSLVRFSNEKNPGF